MINIFLLAEKLGDILFTVVSISEKKKSKREVFFDLFRKPRINIEEVFTEKGKGFLVCHTEKHRGKIPWCDIKKTTPYENFILPFGCAPDSESGIKERKPDLLPEIMLFNTAADYIRDNQTQKKISAVIVDRRGILIERTEKLIRSISSVTVISTKTAEYEAFSLEMMKKYGASVTVRDEAFREIDKAEFIFDFKGNEIPLSFSGVAFSECKKQIIGGKILTGGGFTMPYCYEKLWDKNTDKLDFASALCELSGVKELAELKFNELCS